MKPMCTRLAILALAAVLPLGAVAQGALPVSDGATKITAEQRARLAQKLARVDTIVRALQANRETRPSAEYFQWLRETLYSMPLESVMAVAPSTDVTQVSAAVSQASKVREKLLGDINQDLVFVPWAPCRYINTTFLGGKISGARGYDLANNGGPYGGSTGCDPKTLTGLASEDNIGALVLTLTIVDTSTAASPGFATVRPFSSANATALVNWTTSAAGFQLGDSGVVSILQNPATVNEIEIFTSGPVHAIVDLAGAFVANHTTPLNCVVGTTVFSAALAPGNTFNIQAGTCPAGYSVVANACAGTGDFLNLTIAGSGVSTPSQTFCQGRYSGSGGATASNTPFCCKIPGR